MKKGRNSKKPDTFTKLLIRNWIICIISLALIIFLYFYFPKLFGRG